jgi:hypothetical protein
VTQWLKKQSPVNGLGYTAIDAPEAEVAAVRAAIKSGAVTELAPPPIGFAGARDHNPNYPYIDADDLLFAVADLFASDAKLAKDVVDLRASKRADGKRFSLFNYLFVDTGPPALGTKYTICAHRCRTPEERKIARGAWMGNQVLEGGH